MASRDSLYCQLQSRLEIGATLAAAKVNKPAYDTLLALLPAFPTTGDPAFDRLRCDYHYNIAFAGFYGNDQPLATSHIAIADSLIQGMDQPGSELRARIHRIRGTITYFMLENAFEAQDHYEKAYREWQLIPHKDSVELAIVLQCMGQAAGKLGEYDKSVSLYKLSLDIRQALYGPDHWRVGWAYWNIGNTQFYAERYDSARVAYEKALDILHRSAPDDLLTIGRIYTNLGLSYSQLKLDDKALQTSQAAIDVLIRSEGRNSIGLVNSYVNNAMNLSQLRRFDEAHGNIAKALTVCKANGLETGSQIGLVLAAKGEITYAQFGPTIATLRLAHQAICCIAPSTSPDDLAYFPKPDDTNDPQRMEQIGLLAAEIFLSMATKAKSEIHLYESSLAGYHLVAALQNRMREEFEDRDDKLSLGRRSSRFLDNALQASVAAYQLQNDPKFLDEALFFMEHNKAQVLIEFFRRAKLSAFGQSAPLRSLDLLRRRTAELDYLLSVPGTSDSASQALSAELLEKRMQQKALIDSLQSASSLYRVMDQAHVSPTITSLQELLSRHTLLVTYTVTDSNLYVLSIDRHKAHLRQTPQPPGFTDSLLQWKSLCSQPATQVEEVRHTDKLGHWIYQLLLQPELQHGDSLTDLLLIPDELLGQIPFEALTTSESDGQVRHYGQLQYLIKSIRCHYASSAALWRDQVKGATANEPLQCLGMAFGAQPLTVGTGALQHTLRGLPGTEQELEAIKTYVQGQYWSGEEATEARFKALAPQFGVLHLALHAKASESDPYILFRAGGSQEEDGTLYFHELFQLPLRARLAVLSACETGAGQVMKGEGIQSLSTGFAAAGVPSVIMSLWEVNDNAGSSIMQGLYKGLMDGQPLDLSLHQAKVQYLQDADGMEAAPYYWSAYVTMGLAAPMQLAKHSPTTNVTPWFLGSILCIFVASVIYWVRVRKHRASPNT